MLLDATFEVVGVYLRQSVLQSTLCGQKYGGKEVGGQGYVRLGGG